jgi:hypothetical protein
MAKDAEYFSCAYRPFVFLHLRFVRERERERETERETGI